MNGITQNHSEFAIFLLFLWAAFDDDGRVGREVRTTLGRAAKMVMMMMAMTVTDVVIMMMVAVVMVMMVVMMVMTRLEGRGARLWDAEAKNSKQDS